MSISYRFNEQSDSFSQLSSCTLEEGNQAMVETNKFVVYEDLLFCIPLIGQFTVCLLRNPKAPVLLSEVSLLVDGSSPSISDKSSSMSQSESILMASESSKPSPLKVSLTNKFFSKLKENVSKVKGMFNKKQKKEVASKPIYSEDSMIDEVIVLHSQLMTQVSRSLQIMLCGRFKDGVRKFLLDIEVDDTECKLITIVEDDLKEEQTMMNELRSNFLLMSSSSTSLPEKPIRIVEVKSQELIFYEINKQNQRKHTESLDGVASSKCLITNLSGTALLQYSMGKLKIANFSGQEDLKWTTVCNVDYDIALLHASEDGIVVMSTFNEIFVIDLSNVSQKSKKESVKRIQPSIELNNMVLKTAAV